MRVKHFLPWRSAVILAALGSAFFLSWETEVHPATAGSPSIPRPVGDYPLPGDSTRWDYMSLDPIKSLLYIAHLGDSVVVAVNTKNKAVAATVDHIGHVHGVLAIPDIGRVYASATKTDEVVVIDTIAFKEVARIPGGAYPDGMAYASEVHKLYVSDETGGTETVIDITSNRRIATIPLGGSVGNTQYDTLSKHILVNVQGTGELVEIDPSTDKIVQRMQLPGAKGNHGLLIEPARHWAFIACEGNDKLLVLDLNTRKTLFRFEVGSAPDVLAYDNGLGLLYVASESGFVSVFSIKERGMSKIGETSVGPDAHTVTVDPSTHEVYFPLKMPGRKSILRVMRPLVTAGK